MLTRTLLCLCAAVLCFSGTARADDKTKAAEIERLRAEIDALKNKAGERDALIANLQKELQAVRQQAAQEAAKARVLQERAEAMLAEMERLHRVVADPSRAAQTVKSARGLIASGAEALPGLLPAYNAHGKVIRVGDANLVEISIGADAGIRTGHTLDVFRIVPENPKASVYLGKLTILRAEPKAAVGRYSAAARDRLPKAGDEVAVSVDGIKR